MLNLLNLDLLNIATFLCLAFWALRAFGCLAVGSRHSILFVIITHFLFAGVPLLLDVLFGKPEYPIFPGFYLATRDAATSIIYCLYVSAAPVFWWWSGRGDRSLNITSAGANITIDTASFLQKRKLALQLILFIFLLSPLIAWMYSPNPEIYRHYGVAITDSFKFETEQKYHNIITLFCYLSLVGATGILALQKQIDILIIIFLLPWILLVFWLNGKRGIVGFAIVLLGYVFWQKGYLIGIRFFIVNISLLLIILFFSFTYQAQVRDISIQSVSLLELYENMRIDYGRDAEIKMTIFAELYPEQIQILEQRGQSILFYITQFVPRAIWPQKPMTYKEYFTCAALMIPPKLLGWGVTTSWLEEAIANFSWFGIILGPLMLSVICRLGDARKNEFISPLTVLVACLFMTVELAGFWQFFYLWLISVILLQSAKTKTMKAFKETYTNE